MNVPSWWTPELLLFVFATHLPFFVWRWRRTGEARFAATSLTFALLVLAYGLRVFAPDARLFGVALFPWARRLALVSAAVSVSLLARHLARRVSARIRR